MRAGATECARRGGVHGGKRGLAYVAGQTLSVGQAVGGIDYAEQFELVVALERVGVEPIPEPHECVRVCACVIVICKI